MHKTVGMKPKLQWRPQKLRDARNVERVPRKGAAHEDSQPEREATWAATSKAMRVGLPKPFGTCIYHHVPQIPDMEVWDLMFAQLSFAFLLV